MVQFFSESQCSNIRIVFVENASTGCGVESKQTLTAQQVHAKTRAILIHSVETQLFVMSKKQNCVSQRDGVVEVPLSLTLGRRINLTVYHSLPL